MAQALKKLMRKHKVAWSSDYSGKKSAPQSKAPEPRSLLVQLDADDWDVPVVDEPIHDQPGIAL
eukprot:12604157-Alexandrium_andersonii.AAC.1